METRAQSSPPSADDLLRSDLAHLHRRLGFGATAAELDAAVTAGWDATVSGLLTPTGTDPGVAATPPPTLSPVSTAGKAGTPQKKAASQQLRGQHQQLATWWIERMVAAREPFPEKLTLFWHGHFATSIAKVRQAAWMLRQNEIFRTKGQAPFHDLTLAVAQDPAMMIWLDTVKDTAADPNENFARELMELFTLGVGNYTEDDVRAGARCFTGWSYDRSSGAFRERPRAHDTGSKTFLGHTGNLEGTDVISIVTSLPASARWVTTRLWNRFAAPATTTDPAVIRLTPPAPVDTAALLARIVADPEFRSARATLVAEPIEYVVGALRQLGVKPVATVVSKALTGLGQVPFDPPNVGGWPAGTGWLTSAAALARLDFARTVVAAADLSPVADAAPSSRVEAVGRLLSLPDGFSAQTTAGLAKAGGDPATLVALALVSPEYVTR